MGPPLVNIIAHTFKKSETEQGFFIAGIYPNKGEGGFNRLDWLAEFEQLNGISDA
ncbi:MAG: hypothetical protein VX125_12885 [Pseudomonadota bacterium]|nr:hypothetical protein [Pseudomonadota bacterium]